MANSSIYKYYPLNGDQLECIVCCYRYRKNAPLSTLQKHIRVKHHFSIRHPLSSQDLVIAQGEARFNFFKYVSTQPKNVTYARIPVLGLLNTKEMPQPTLNELIVSEWMRREDISLDVATSVAFNEMLQSFDPNFKIPCPNQLALLNNVSFQ